LAPAFIGTTIFYHQNYMTTLNDWPPQLFAMSLLVLSLTTVGLRFGDGFADRPLWIQRGTAILPHTAGGGMHCLGVERAAN
jgi:hypothetical protein